MLSASSPVKEYSAPAVFCTLSPPRLTCSYVHRLIQTRTDGKLVELPSASSLITHYTPTTTPSRPSPLTGDLSHNDSPGPSSNDIDKISTIEAITLEYSYLLSSQLEAMRQHYESSESRLRDLETIQSRVDASERERVDAQRVRAEAEARLVRAEKKAEKAAELSRSLQASLSAERAMSSGMSERIKVLSLEAEVARAAKGEEQAKVGELEELVRDLQFALEARAVIAQGGNEAGAGGDVVLVQPKKGRR